jgi:integrase
MGPASLFLPPGEHRIADAFFIKEALDIRVEHPVHLSSTLRPDPENKRGVNGGLLLPGAVGTPFAGWSKAKRALDKAIRDTRAKGAAITGTSPARLVPWNVHDLRRTVATGLQRLGVRLEVTEAVLNHISGSRGGIAGVYQRHDWASEKRAALDAWAAHVRSVAEGSNVGPNVVTLARPA